MSASTVTATSPVSPLSLVGLNAVSAAKAKAGGSEQHQHDRLYGADRAQ